MQIGKTSVELATHQEQLAVVEYLQPLVRMLCAMLYLHTSPHWLISMADILILQADVTVAELVSAGVSVEQANVYAGDKMKALHAASHAGHLEVVRFLAKQCDGVDLNYETKDDKTCTSREQEVCESSHPYNSK